MALDLSARRPLPRLAGRPVRQSWRSEVNANSVDRLTSFHPCFFCMGFARATLVACLRRIISTTMCSHVLLRQTARKRQTAEVPRVRRGDSFGNMGLVARVSKWGPQLAGDVFKRMRRHWGKIICIMGSHYTNTCSHELTKHH